MESAVLLPCRHRAGPDSAGVHPCRSPKLAGLKLVTPEVCGACYCRDHEPASGPAAAPLLPCAHLGPAEEGTAVHACSHPNHKQTTAAFCRTCPDYLFPVLTRLTPVPAVQRLLTLSPLPQPEGWGCWANVQEAFRRSTADFIACLAPCPGGFRDWGVVMVGGGKYFPSAYLSLRLLRHLGCRLPVQLWHFEGEITPRMQELLRPLAVHCVDADAAARERPFRFLAGHWWKGWQLKAYALAACPFKEVLLLDADCYPTRDPTFLFGWRPYRKRGAIFWPDSSTSSCLLTPSQWAAFGVEPCQPPFESGQLLVHKQRCWRELQLALWYNAHADFVYQILWGDKDTFNVAWRQLGREYAMPRPKCGWDLHTILQYGPDGGVLFQHRCRDKFRLEDTPFPGTSQNFAANEYNPRLAHEDLCFQWRDELQRAWEAKDTRNRAKRKARTPKQG